MAKIKWEEPPESKTGGNTNSKWRVVADQLKERPGKWALIAESKPYAVYATYVNKGRLAAFTPAGAFEGTSRKKPDGNFDIYARYVGEPGE